MDLGGFSHYFWYSFLGNQKRCIEPPASCFFEYFPSSFLSLGFLFFKEKKGYAKQARYRCATGPYFLHILQFNKVKL